MDLNKLGDTFLPEEIEWRVLRTGKREDGSIWAVCVAYIDNRAIMNRLDLVCGPGKWSVKFHELSGSGIQPGIVATIGVLVDGVGWVEKSDGSEQTDTEPFKGGLSSAMKRAAVQWNIGRYLYLLEEGFAKTSTTKIEGWKVQKTKEGTWFWWVPPPLPDWALPKGAKNPEIKVQALPPSQTKIVGKPKVVPKPVTNMQAIGSGPLGPEPPEPNELDIPF